MDDLQTDRALKGLKVLDLGQSAAVLLITKYLADHGATAIWIESKSHVDVTRMSAPYSRGRVHPNRSLNAANLMTSRRSFGLNIRKAESVEIVKKLVAWADIVISSYPRGVLERHGLGPEDLRSVNPGAIIVSGSALGSNGPYAEQRGFGWAQKALAGVIEYTGWPDRLGVGVPEPYSDFCTPWITAAAVLAALERRRETGEGAHVDFSHLEATLSYVPSYLLLQYTANREIPVRMGNRNLNSVPSGSYPCRGDNRWCVISVSTDEEWQALVLTINLSWARDPKFNTFPGRKQNEDELDRLIGNWTINFDHYELMAKLQSAGVPAGVVQNYAEILERDPQTNHRGFFTKLSRPELENVSHIGWPAKLSKTPAVIRPTPRMGEHTKEICMGILNMSEEEFGELLSKEVLEVD